MKKIGKNTYEVKIGNTIKASTSSVAFLWKNWHYFYELFPEKISAELIADNEWIAKGFNTFGRFHLYYCEIKYNTGRFEFFASIIKYRFFKSFQAKITLEYSRVDANKISYYLTTQVKLPSLFSPFVRLLHGTADAAAVYINVIGADAAELISKSPTELENKCGKNAFEIFQAFTAEEQNIINGKTGEFNYFSNVKWEPDPGNNEDPLIRFFGEEVKEFATKNKAIYNDLQKSLELYMLNPESALSKNRKISEVIINDIIDKERVRIDPLIKKSRSQQLFDYWEKVGAKENNQIIIHFMDTVRTIGNTATHSPNTIFFPESFKVSFQALLPICKWYEETYNKKTT